MRGGMQQQQQQQQQVATRVAQVCYINQSINQHATTPGKTDRTTCCTDAQHLKHCQARQQLSTAQHIISSSTVQM